MEEFRFKSKEPINRGWSQDKKYCVTDEKGTRYLLRTSLLEPLSYKEAEFKMMQQLEALGVPMCTPIAFGTCKEGVYSIQSWIEGKDAKDVLPNLLDSEAYAYGLKAGRVLKLIHSIPAPADCQDWDIRFNKKIDGKLKGYADCPIKYHDGEAFVQYVNSHRYLLKNRPQVYQHGDYHIGNMMIEGKGQLKIIDFNRIDYGDPWEEFNRIVWCVDSSPLFASGMINGYFNSSVPIDFWKLLALYIATNTLSSISWAIPFGQKEIDTMLDQAKQVLKWYDTMRNTIPRWYVSG